MTEPIKGIFRIGTSGIVVPGSKQSFPPEYQNMSRLNYYSSLFNTLEVNSTFKKIPMLSTFEKWSSEVPGEFQFTIKAWKEITHKKQLNIDLENIDKFFKAASHIGHKKGCLLVQFPGSITAAYRKQVENILQQLQTLDPDNQWKKAVESRSVTWYTNETYDLLEKYNASLVLHDMPKSKNLALPETTSFLYFRFHGPLGDYKGSYTEEFLNEQAEKIRHALNNEKDVYAYFNNTMGNAFDNAMLLKSLVEK